MTVAWRAAALADLARIARHITAENPLAAQRVAREPLLAGDSLEVFPRRGRPGRATDTRELAAVRPYILVHETAEDGSVSILRVWHAAQDR